VETKFFPSLLSADFGALQGEILRVQDLVSGFHFDVMDGHFVPNLTCGPPVLACLKSRKIFDVHLMISAPENFVESFARAGAGQISIHAETTRPAKVLQQIRDLHLPAGIVFNPNTPVDFDLCAAADFVLVMSVEPGFGGQSFQESSLGKIAAIRERFPEKNIQVDGGINFQTAAACRNAGANWLVSGSFFFKSEDPAQCAKEFLQL